MIPNATVFVSSACIMIIELVAGRLIARHVGSSIYTWTSVIGVVLAGIALGNYVGGRIADRFSSKRTLAVLFLVSSATAAGISLFDNIVAGWTILGELSWPMHVASHVALVFFLPSTMLGTISPVVAKMALDLGYQTGRTIGSVYAWGAVGSIVGTFLTGFWLIAWFGTQAIVWGVAGIMIVLALLYWAGSWMTWGGAAALAAVAVLANGPWTWARTCGEALVLRRPLSDSVIYADETQYSYLEIVYLDKARNTRAFHLDKLVHSQVDMEHPTNLFYGYERICSAVTNRLSRGKQHVSSLTIGGGGYVFPRYMEAVWPGSRTDVVEIDPAVTEAAKVAFGLPEDTPIRSFHEDGRVFVDRLHRTKAAGGPVEPYDFIYLDVFDDVSVPYQLTTVEFASKIRSLLTPTGAYLINTIDIYDEGLFLGSFVRTLREVFPYVYVFIEGAPVAQSHALRNTFVIAALQREMDVHALGDDARPACTISSLSDVELERLVQRDAVRVLTDDHAPVENLLAAVVQQHAEYHAVGEKASYHFQQAQRWDDLGEYEKAVVEYRKGLTYNPSAVPALYSMGNTCFRLREFDEALNAYSEVVRLDPANFNAYFMMGNTYAIREQYEEAARCYRQVLILNPDDEKARSNLERVLRLKQNPDAAAPSSPPARP